MSEIPKTPLSPSASKFSRQVGAQAARKLRAQRNGAGVVWSGLSVMGLIGWSVVVPTLLGAALGRWLDQHYSMSHSWTLPLLVIGLGLGCWNAWHWVNHENQRIQEQDDE